MDWDNVNAGWGDVEGGEGGGGCGCLIIVIIALLLSWLS